MTKRVITPMLQKDYITAVRAQGSYIYDETNKCYLDASSGAITCSIGHSHPEMISVIHEQMQKLQFVYRSQFSSTEAENLAQMLCERSENEVYEHVFFVNSGTEAIETAMKMALQYWQETGQPKKTFFLSRRISYHGITMGALSLSGHPLRRQRFEGLLEKYPLLHADLEADSLKTHLKELKKVIESVGSEHIAALVLEPVVGAAGGAIVPPKKYYKKVAELCKNYNILFIADEVMTGLGRTGSWFGLDHWDTTADIVAVGKSLGAGYAPIAATLCKKEIVESIKNGSGVVMSGHTYSAHPLSCKAASTVLSIIENENLLQRVNLVGDRLKNELMKMKKSIPFIKKVRGKGLLLGMEFESKQNRIQESVLKNAQENGLLLYPSAGGKYGKEENSILIAPPFTITDNEIDELLEKLYKTLQNL